MTNSPHLVDAITHYRETPYVKATETPATFGTQRSLVQIQSVPDASSRHLPFPVGDPDLLFCYERAPEPSEGLAPLADELIE
jgi:hypothetical protein